MDRRGAKRALIFGVFVALVATTFVVGSPTTEVLAQTCTPRHCPDPGEPDGEEEKFTGSVLVSEDGDVAQAPGSDGSGGTCEDCHWDLKPVCEIGGQATCNEHATCTGEDDPRPYMRFLYDVMFRQGDSAWERVSTFCMDDPSEAHDTEDVGEQVREDWAAYVPELDPSAQPRDGKTLVGIDTIFHSGQPAKMPTETIPVYNFEIRLTATGEWFWTFEPGVSDSFTIPGSRHPDTTVSHIYERVGDYSPSVRTEWHGTFWVGDEGPFEIPTPATQGPVDMPMQAVESSPVLTR